MMNDFIVLITNYRMNKIFKWISTGFKKIKIGINSCIGKIKTFSITVNSKLSDETKIEKRRKVILTVMIVFFIFGIILSCLNKI